MEFNKVIMLGNLTRDCELRYLPSGGAVCTTGLATNRRFKKQDGSQAEEVCFIDITFFGRTAEIANQYLKRGSKVLVEGRLKLDQWTDQQGAKRSKHSITVETLQMLDGRDGSNNEGNGGQGGNQAPRTSQPRQSQGQQQGNQPEYSGHDIPDLDINDDEIPF
ncbi:single-stranded DNA-binding protein [Sulfurospirillum multivorans]|uniref:Single-stranded DNA-binding protein n=2 Tax=Sulfurospirillum multivorans TaxID=66821 RepID=A0AA86ANX4_SULMK|nr:single-stranded DNA-binding protein [Sulfurospirillum multivorans]AHJ13087.1 single-stranded DNA-binding protein [Sulfurospirillum multivorans DSM 12446]QEH06575.1 single-stranded DNA-binding protein [Sulfurospirillum multivorans]